MPFLTGEAQRAYYSLQALRNEQYDDLKAEILAQVGLSLTCAAQQLNQWSYDEQSPMRPLAQLARLAHLWLLAGALSANQVVERVVLTGCSRLYRDRCDARSV